MRIETATEPGSPDHPNEDFTCVASPVSGQGGTLVLLDGVTPHPTGTGCVHGVPWYVSRLGGAMLELSVSRRDMMLEQCLARAIAQTSATHRDTCDLYHHHTPQSTVVAVRWDDRSVEHLVLSDSVLLVEDPAGRVDAVLDERLRRLPEPVPSARAALRALPPRSPERPAARARHAHAVESLRNAEGGFFTAAADPAVAARAVSGVRPREEVRAVAALTDGATRLVEVFGESDWERTFATLAKGGCQELLARVRAAEDADPEGTAFPRGKPHDDATAVFVQL